jgi:hypothetical protein
MTLTEAARGLVGEVVAPAAEEAFQTAAS